MKSVRTDRNPATMIAEHFMRAPERFSVAVALITKTNAAKYTL